MFLKRVVYELFWFEEGRELGPEQDYEGLYRQIRLETTDGACEYISWDWGQGKEDYFVAHGRSSFFTTLPDKQRDVSDTSTWQPLVGREVTITYRDQEWQVIEVRSGASVVYCCSFAIDRVFVMRKLRLPV